MRDPDRHRPAVAAQGEALAEEGQVRTGQAQAREAGGQQQYVQPVERVRPKQAPGRLQTGGKVDAPGMPHQVQQAGRTRKPGKDIIVESSIGVAWHNSLMVS